MFLPRYEVGAGRDCGIVNILRSATVVGYAAAGIGGGFLAALIPFTPSFLFILVGGPASNRFERTLRSRRSSPRAERSDAASVHLLRE
jgi:hypothetical protein